MLCTLIVLPLVTGSIFTSANTKSHSAIFRWISGQICLWAGFFAVSIPMILKKRSLTEVIWVYAGFCLLMVLISLAKKAIDMRRGKSQKVSDPAPQRTPGLWILWTIVILLLILQLVLAAVLAYEEGDDAFYVAVSTITAESDTMYRILPYTGFTTLLDSRHALAPFPVWVAALSRISGIHAAIVSQVILPIVLITMAYGVFFLFGKQLFNGNARKNAQFLLVIEAIVIFGGQSLYTSENFMLVRTAQGKAVLACIVLPFLLYLLLLLAQKQEQNEKMPLLFWILMAFGVASGCLCSTQGALLTCILLGIGGGLTALCYRRYLYLLPLAACCALPVGMALLYFVMD